MLIKPNLAFLFFRGEKMEGKLIAKIMKILCFFFFFIAESKGMQREGWGMFTYKTIFLYYFQFSYVLLRFCLYNKKLEKHVHFFLERLQIFSLNKFKKYFKIITILKKKIKTIIYDYYFNILFFYNLIKEYKFCFIQIKNYHELLTKERKYLYYIFI
jgi:hypothetical protein